MSETAGQVVDTPTIDTLRTEYSEACRALGEKTYMVKCLESEVIQLQVLIRDLNKKAADLAAPKEASDGK